MMHRPKYFILLICRLGLFLEETDANIIILHTIIYNNYSYHLCDALQILSPPERWSKYCLSTVHQQMYKQ